MGEILQTWLRTRLGAIMDLAPEIFGHYTRDGYLLAQILHSYDIISRSQLETITRTQDPALCRVNLKHLRVWLRFLGIECDDECIEEISCSKGTTALRLFYRVYLCLENKDRLHFITLQKERERYIPASTKFDVSTVCEDPPPYVPAEHPLSKRLHETTDKIRWQRDKLLTILRSCKRERDRFEASRTYPVVEHVEHYAAELSEGTKGNEMAELDEFARKHKVRVPRSKDHSIDEFPKKTRVPAEDPRTAKSYIERLKGRSKRAGAFEALKSRMQKTLLSELCERVTEKQEREFDEFLAGEVLQQSRYEKQMLAKLGETRNRKDVIAENRKIVEDLLSKAREDEGRAEEEREKESLTRDAEDVDAECRRMCELRRRIREEKTRKLQEKHRRMCTDIMEDLVKITVKMAEYRRKTDGRVPSTILSEWKASFRECRPIFGAADIVMDDEESNGEKKHEEEEEEEEEEKEEESSKSVFQLKLDNLESFRESIFRSYQNSEAPWDGFAPKIREDDLEAIKSGETILGHVVHRLLEFLYPYPIRPAGATLPPLKVIAAVLGISNSREVVEELLVEKRIRVVRLEDAINYCLSRYKSEMRDTEYIDLKIVEATAKTVKELGTGRKNREEVKEGASTGRSKKSVETRVLERGREGALEKETQTPRNIPYDDMHPVLTDAAYVGKWTYEFLSLGQPISNELETKILIEYLKSLTDVEGWVLIDYPGTYDQMSRLESELTGQEVPADSEVLDFRTVSIEDVVPRAPRMVFEDGAADVFALNRQSKLLPNPIPCKADRACNSTFLTDYVKVVPKPRDQRIVESETYEVLSETAPSLDRFYADRGIAHVFYYGSLDRQTLATLTTFLLNHPSENASGRFPEAGTELKSAQSSKAPIIRRLLTKPPTASLEEKHEENLGEVNHAEMQSKLEDENVESSFARENEEDWQFVDLSLPPVLLETLANLWESLEDIYIEDLKDVLLLRYVHAISIVPYTDLLTRSTKNFVERPDDRQLLLTDFQRFYNSVEQDARDDIDAKCELHRRVADLQSALWEMCDRRRKEAEEMRIRLAQENWTTIEAIALYNVYASLLQAEVDRCVDTVELLGDYYNAMLRKPLQEARLSKDCVVNKVEMDTERSTDVSDHPVPFEKSTERKDRKERSKSKPGSSKSPVTLDRARLEEAIFDFLISTDEQDYDVKKSFLYESIMENFRSVRKFVEDVESKANEIRKKEGGAKTRGSKGKSVDSVDDKVTSEERDVLKQWRYAVDYETWRIRYRLEMLAAAAEADVAFLLDTVRRTFRQIYDSIVGRYKREIKSVNDMANVFCLAIEEGKPLEMEISLKGDRFIIRPKPSTSIAPDIKPTLQKEVVSALQFQIEQLARLLRIFKRVAPQGTLIERAFVYILQDLIAYGNQEDDLKILPCAWYDLRPKDMTKVVRRVFGTSERIDWREFFIYSLDLPIPSYQEILQARHNFRSHDPRLKETVTREQYNCIPLWFLKDEENAESSQTREFREVSREFEEEDFGDESYPDSLRTFNSIIGDSSLRIANAREENSTKNVADLKEKKCALSKEPSTELEENIVSRVASGPVFMETTRLAQARELLWQMYLVDRTEMNYTALLLGFCKDDDPLEGFAKALTLAIGGRVCSDVELGEKYIAELLEEKRRRREMELSLQRKAFEAVEAIIDYLLVNIVRIVAETELRGSHDDNLTQYPSVVIQILDETDPLELLSNASTYEDSSIIDEGEYRRASTSSNGWTMEESPEGIPNEETTIYWLPREICLTVLAATLPWHAGQTDLAGCTWSLREGIARVYEELWDENLNEQPDVVLAHRLLHHDFITLLLNDTSKFSVKNVGEIVREILQERGNIKTLSSTFV